MIKSQGEFHGNIVSFYPFLQSSQLSGVGVVGGISSDLTQVLHV